MKNIIGLLICLFMLSTNAVSGSVVTVTESSATWKVDQLVSPGDVNAIFISTNTIDIYSEGVLAAQISTPGGGVAQIRLKNPIIGEKPNIASMANSNTGLAVTNGVTSHIFNSVATWSFGRNGAGLGQLLGNSITARDNQDTSSPVLTNELNHDGLSWIDNRLPDGVLGHDKEGRFIRFRIDGGRQMSVGFYGVQIGTHTLSNDGVATSTLTVGGRIESLSGGIKFPDGTIQTSAAQGQSNVFDSFVLTPQATAPSSPAVGEHYLNSVSEQVYWWNGTQWLVAW